MGSGPGPPFGLEDKGPPKPPGRLILEDLQTLRIHTNKKLEVWTQYRLLLSFLGGYFSFFSRKLWGKEKFRKNPEKSQACYIKMTLWGNWGGGGITHFLPFSAWTPSPYSTIRTPISNLDRATAADGEPIILLKWRMYCSLVLLSRCLMLVLGSWVQLCKQTQANIEESINLLDWGRSRNSRMLGTFRWEHCLFPSGMPAALAANSAHFIWKHSIHEFAHWEHQVIPFGTTAVSRWECWMFHLGMHCVSYHKIQVN